MIIPWKWWQILGDVEKFVQLGLDVTHDKTKATELKTFAQIVKRKGCFCWCQWGHLTYRFYSVLYVWLTTDLQGKCSIKILSSVGLCAAQIGQQVITDIWHLFISLQKSFVYFVTFMQNCPLTPINLCVLLI